jgi:iron complex outermembrane recepter protein
MVGIKFLLCALSLLVIGIGGAGTAAADEASSSLRMRTGRPARRLAQPLPDPAGPGPVDDGATPESIDDGLAPPGVVQWQHSDSAGSSDSRNVIVGPTPTGGTRGVARTADLPFTTGSLIERTTRIAPSPLTVVTREDLLASGRTMLGDILQAETTQGNAINAQFNNGGDGSTRIDLRSLGAVRTLVLLDGRRFVNVGNGGNASVDLNTIPLAAVERVEILKDAAAAVYGSDAVGGVVNVITRSNFTGTEASVYTGQTEREDGFTIDASVIHGARSDSGRGNIIFSAGVQRQDPVFAGDREFSFFDKAFNFANQTVVNGGSTSIPAGRINTAAIDTNGDGRVNAQDVRPDICGPHPINPGVPDPNQFCVNDGRGGFRPFIAPDDLYNFQPENFLYTPSSRFNAHSAGTFRLLPEVAAFYQTSFLHRESDQRLAPEPFANNAAISRDSIFNPFGATVFGYQRRLEELGPRRSPESVDTFRLVTGLQGALPEGAPALKWELSLNLGRSTATQKHVGNLIRSRTAAALGPSFVDALGIPRCGTPVAPIPGCVPMNILGPSGSVTPDAAAFVSFNGESTGLNEQLMVLATMHGRIARLPNNGDLSIAFGTDVRRDRAEVVPDALITLNDTTAANLEPLNASTNVLESFAEAVLVAARDESGRELLEIDVAARAFRYENPVSGVAWNARALLRPAPGITLRASTARGFHAPTLTDLFRGANELFPVARDPCDTLGVPPPSPSAREQCARQGVPANAVFGTVQQRVVDRGNPNVGAEQAEVVSAGAVLEPFGSRDLALSVDFWRADVTELIQSLPINVIFASCYERGLQEFCDLVHRNPQLNFAIDFVDAPTSNLGGIATSGIDVSVDLEGRTPDGGQLRVRAEAQRLLNYDVDNSVQVLQGLGVYDLGVHPQLKANLTASWQSPGSLGAGVNARFVGDFLECDQNNCNAGLASRQVEAWRKVDVFGTYSLGGPAAGTTLTMGVNNVFDEVPPTIFVGFQADSDAATYDYLGRFFYARLTQRF